MTDANVFLRVLGGRKRLNTEVTEILRALRVEALEARRRRSIWFWLRLPGCAVRLIS
jgi:hypothetical protein